MGEKKVTIELDGEKYGFPLRVRDENDTFSTGSRGYSCNGQRFYHENKGYIVSVNLVEIGSKPEKPP